MARDVGKDEPRGFWEYLIKNYCLGMQGPLLIRPNEVYLMLSS
jgi:hypothetical protein